MKYPVYYLDEPGTRDILEAANPRDAAQQFFSKHPRNGSCCIRVETGEGALYSHFDAVQFMDESARALLPRVPPPPPLVTGGRLFLCPDCGTPVSRKAASCPKCGRVFRSAQQTGLFGLARAQQRGGCTWIIIIALGIVLGILLISFG